jgi:hypothetical protein
MTSITRESMPAGVRPHMGWIPYATVKLQPQANVAL